MAEAGVDAFLVPRADAHQGENVAPRDERLAWLTGFTGSAGLAVVTADRAGDLRRRALPAAGAGARSTPSCFEVRAHPEDKPADWLVEALPRRRPARVRPLAAHRQGDRGRWPRRSAPRQIGLARVGEPDRPGLARPAAAAGAADRAAPGRARRARRPPTSAPSSPAGSWSATSPAAVLTLPDSIAWLLNVRGSDIARTPVPLAFAILHADGRVDLFTDPAKCDDAAARPSRPRGRVAPPEAFGPALDALQGRVAVDQASAPVWVSDRLAAAGQAEVVWERDPCILPKACKTEAEIAGARAAHLRDGAAMAEFLAWLDADRARGRADRDRRGAAARGDPRRDRARCATSPSTRSAAPGRTAPSCTTGSPRRPTARSRPGELLLVDSGAQYPDGTTDVTRTVAIGAGAGGGGRGRSPWC